MSDIIAGHAGLPPYPPETMPEDPDLPDDDNGDEWDDDGGRIDDPLEPDEEDEGAIPV